MKRAGVRILAGEAKGRRLEVASPDVRPTASRVREALFGMVAPRLPGAVVLDLFAGSGALGFEALSRGAARCTFLDDSERVVEALRRTASMLGFDARTEVLRDDATVVSKRLAGQCYDLVVLDPPWGQGRVEATLGALGSLLAPDADIFVVHERGLEVMPPLPWTVVTTRRYGDSMLTRLGVP